MEIRQLRYFVAAADYGSFTKAAEHCQVSQPTLSQQIAKLEQQLGRPVFERLARSVVLTDEGRLLLEHARQILALAETAKEEIDQAAAAGKGRVAIAAIPTVAPYLLPPILKTFRKSCPHALVEVEETTTDLCLEMCVTGQVDLALLALPIEGEEFHVQPLFEDELLVGLNSKHPMATKQQVTLAQLRDEPFILLDEAHCLTGNVLSFCQQKDLHPIVNCRSSQLQTVQGLIALAHGVSLVPNLAIGQRQKGVVYRRLSGRPSRTVALAWHRHRFRSQLARQMIETIEQTCQNLS